MSSPRWFVILSHASWCPNLEGTMDAGCHPAPNAK
jgi:hypothetical protein